LHAAVGVATTDEPAIPAGWSVVTWAEGRFRAAFPATPKAETAVFEIGDGKSQTLIYDVSPKDDGSYLKDGFVRTAGHHVRRGAVVGVVHFEPEG